MSTRKVEYIRCDICGKEIDQLSNHSDNPDYIRMGVTIPVFMKTPPGINYGVDFVEKDICEQCLRKITNVRIKEDSSNSDKYPFELEIIDGTNKSHNTCKF